MTDVIRFAFFGKIILVATMNLETLEMQHYSSRERSEQYSVG